MENWKYAVAVIIALLIIFGIYYAVTSLQVPSTVPSAEIGNVTSSGTPVQPVATTPLTPPPPTKITGKYVKLSNPDICCMNIADVEIYSSGVNVAKGKTVTMSSLLDATNYPLTYLVDDIFTNFAHTSCNEAPWMQIDLGSSMTIDKIKVYNRSDCCSGRTAGSKLEILSDANVVVWSSDVFKNKTGLTKTQDDHSGFATYEASPPDTTLVTT